MKNVKTGLLATLVSFMMVTSTLANPISNDADLIFSNDNAQVQTMDFARLSTSEMQETEGAIWQYYVLQGISYGTQAALSYGTYHIGSWRAAGRTWANRWGW